ncbi:MAG: hypothetical protein HND57_02750 [Planctomycetes bacterium]|nr:hypothetical protein [Planctomycetota bacterium]
MSNTMEELAEALGQDLLAHSLNCYRFFGDFHLALSGRPDAGPVYRHLMLDPVMRGIPWRRSHVWLVDEFGVDPVDERARWRLVQEVIGDHAGVPTSQLHPIPGLSRRAADDYELEIQSALEWRERGQDRLDYVLLTLSGDGTVAGLRPGCSVLSENRRHVRMIHQDDNGDADGFDHTITMTYPMINAARFVAVIVAGAENQPVIDKLVAHADKQGSADACTSLPALGLNPIGGELRWYVDRSACPTSR